MEQTEQIILSSFFDFGAFLFVFRKPVKLHTFGNEKRAFVSKFSYCFLNVLTSECFPQ